ncbi:nuclear transport factor 2 family protein [Caballeronia sp. INDeC2]|uniref:nuclear transport factor 2 family protein n=1 Tax=Caballeronia sp. INDeC2 TaxID=2921747 RepID=UPI0025419926|nr:nuclear transport factor 2 family protein [Caballeronia sp. INDeC2]
MSNDLLSPALAAAVQRYFDVLYECDLEKFDRLFHPACHLFTVVDGAEKVLTLAAYREVITARQSPMSQGHPREEALIAAFPLSGDIAMFRLRVRLGTVVYQDHIHFVRSGDEWRIAAKLYAPDC